MIALRRQARPSRSPVVLGWSGRLLVALVAAALSGPELPAAAPIYDAAALNIGLNCQWQNSCIRAHSGAKNRALKYVAKYHPPTWRVQLCNRNSRRGALRVDWIGFDHCIRNVDLREPPPPPPPSRKKRLQRRARVASY